MLQTAGSVRSFRRAVATIDGLEWLTDIVGEDVGADVEGVHFEEDPEKPLSSYLYLMMTSQAGLRQVLRMWRLWKEEGAGATLDRGAAPWKQLFALLVDVRSWGSEDRLRETGLTENWRERVEAGEEYLPAEVEMVWRGNQVDRTAGQTAVRDAVIAAGGEVVRSAELAEIRYHAVLVKIPIAAMDNVLSEEAVSLVNCNSVMFLRPQSVVVVAPSETHEEEPEAIDAPDVTEDGPPLAGLLDGLPLENHQLLEGRLEVDDPDGWAAAGYPSESRVHGTCMASLIQHGDLELDSSPLSRRLYVRPILRPDPGDFVNIPPQEWMPDDEIPVDFVHRILRRMYEGGADDGEPVAPSVRYINLSVADSTRPFDGIMSPWARLLDWWAYRHGVLFVVAAGNFLDDLELTVSSAELQVLQEDPAALEREVLRPLMENPHRRRLYSPAEAINAISVGAAHADRSAVDPTLPAIDPLRMTGMASPLSRHGPGHRRSVKPDLIAEGGRQLYREVPTAAGDDAARLTFISTPRAPGLLAAAPGRGGGRTDQATYSRGTSNATATITRAAVILHQELRSLADGPGGEGLDVECLPALVKTLLVHGSSWGDLEDLIAEHGFDYEWRKRKAVLSRMCGHGLLDLDRVTTSSDQRVLLVGTGRLSVDEADRYVIAMPPSLSGYTAWRRITATLAWFSPTSSALSGYRMARLELDMYGEGRDEDGVRELLGTDSRVGVDWQAARRGTVQHDIYEEETRGALGGPGDSLAFQVNCREDAGKPAPEQPLSYGLAITIEVAADVEIGLYEELKASLLVPVQPS